MGDQLAEITGVVTYAFGFYRILPLTKISIVTAASAAVAPVDLVSAGNCTGITIGDYNVENMAPTSAHIPKVAAHIVDLLKTPDILMVQEIQDNTGPTNDGVVDANATLSALVAAIAARPGGVSYSFVDVDPVDGQDGGQPGGNIRVAYLYRPDAVELYKPNPGGSLDANEVLPGPELKFNPGRIDPANAAWTASRKPVAAMWRAIKGPQKKIFFTVDVHFASKGGSSSLHGDIRPPLNGVVDGREAQAEATGVSIPSSLASSSPEAPRPRRASADSAVVEIHRPDPSPGRQGPRRRGRRLQRVQLREADRDLRLDLGAGGPRRRDGHPRRGAVHVPLRHEHAGARPHVRQPGPGSQGRVRARARQFVGVGGRRGERPRPVGCAAERLRVLRRRGGAWEAERLDL